MDDTQVEERSPVVVAAGIAGVIVALLLIFGLLARSQMPVEAVPTDNVGDAVVTLPQTDSAESDEMLSDAEEAETTSETEDEMESSEADSSEADSSEADSSEADSSEADSSEADSSEDDSSEAEDTSTAENIDEGSESETESSSSEDTAASEEQPETAAQIETVSTITLAEDELMYALTEGGCSACHTIPNVTGALGQLGPDLTQIGTMAATRVEGLSAAEYIRQSIVEPDAYVVEECPMGPCPADLVQTAGLSLLTDEKVDGIINYLLTLTDSEEMVADAETETEEAAVEADGEEAAGEEADGEETVAEEPAAEEEPFDMAVVTAVVTKGTCGACHIIPGVDIAVGMVGPDLTGIGTIAATRIDGYTAEEYLYESIIDPNAFIAPECPTGDCLANIMLPNLADLLTDEEIDTIVQYLSSLQ